MDNSSNRNRRWNDFGFSLYMKRLKKFEKAFMGTVKSDNHSREVYDYKKCVDILIAENASSPDQAVTRMEERIIPMFETTLGPLFLELKTKA